MNDLSDAVKRTLVDRTSDPFLGTLVISWSVFNWKPLAIIFFQNEPMRERITTVETVYFDGSCSYFFRFGIPLLITCGWIYVYPWLRKKIYDHDQGNRSELLEIKRRHELGDWRMRFGNALYYISTQAEHHSNNRTMALAGDRGIQKGDLVAKNSNDGHLFLASAKEPYKQAIGMVIDTIMDGYYLVQIEGSVENILSDLKPNCQYYLSHMKPGKYAEQPPSPAAGKFETLYTQSVFIANTPTKLTLAIEEAKHT